MAERQLFVATKNAGKMRELRELFAGSGFTLETYDAYADVVEGDTSYAENAALKAVALYRQLEDAGLTADVLGDDSGLEATALGGRPGVLSARYGGPDITWPGRRALLRSELANTGSSDRSARFVCALHFIPSGGSPILVQATVEGRISEADAGTSGFSYDPAFWYPPLGATFAEIDEAMKNAISHRGRAVTELLAAIAARDDAEITGPAGKSRQAGM